MERKYIRKYLKLFKILNLLEIIVPILLLLFIFGDMIYLIIKGDYIHGLNYLIIILSFGFFIWIENLAEKVDISLKEFPNLIRASIGLGIAGVICILILINLLYGLFYDNNNNLFTLDSLDISSVVLTGLMAIELIYACVIFRLRRNNAIFVARFAFVFFIIYVLSWFFIFTRYSNNLAFIFWSCTLIIIAICCIKGICITFGENAKKVFPITQRKIKLIDIILISLCFYMLGVFGYLTNYDYLFPTNIETINSQSIVGNWETTINDRDGEYVTYFNIYSDGTAEMGCYGNNSKPVYDDIKWSQKNDSIYLKVKGERKVEVVRILSLNHNQLIVDFGDDIIFFTRKH